MKIKYYKKRDENERMYGGFIVVIEGDIYERFYRHADAVKYQQACLAAGLSAVILDDSDDNQLLE